MVYFSVLDPQEKKKKLYCNRCLPQGVKKSGNVEKERRDKEDEGEEWKGIVIKKVRKDWVIEN